MNFDQKALSLAEGEAKSITGSVDVIAVDDDKLFIRGWAIDSIGEPVREITVALGDTHLPVWELRRNAREDVRAAIAKAAVNCGFELWISTLSLPPSTNFEAPLHVVAYESSLCAGQHLPKDATCIIDWNAIRRAQHHSFGRQLHALNQRLATAQAVLDTVQDSSLGASVGFDTRQISATNFVAIYGNSDSGKSAFCRSFAENDQVIWVQTDQIFTERIAPSFASATAYTFWAGTGLDGHFNIAAYVDSEFFDFPLFIRYLAEEIRNALRWREKAKLVVLDGYILKRHAEIFVALQIPHERTLALCAEARDGRNYIDEIDVTSFQHEQAIQHICASLRKQCIEKTLPKSKYQSFESFNLQPSEATETSSRSTEKYSASHLDELLRGADSFVDLGCNAGYFCFRAAEASSMRTVIGVDFIREWLEIASHLNNSIFRRDEICFYEADVISFLKDSAINYDIIHCASVYHYLRDQQTEFLRAAHRALSAKGVLVLEVELSTAGVAPELIQKARGVDASPCWFPNKTLFMDQIAGLFEVKEEYTSVFQTGSFFERRYFHLSRL